MEAPAGILSPIPSAVPGAEDGGAAAANARAGGAILRTSDLSDTGACASYPNCMAAPADADALLRPGTRRNRPSQATKRPMGAALYASAAADAPELRTFDLEELGLLHLRGDGGGEDAAAKSIVVDYEDGAGAGGIPHRDRRPGKTQKASVCAPDACQPLGKQPADALAGLPPSASASARRGKSVVVAEREAPAKPEKQDEEDEKLSTSATDNEEEEDERCCKMHKLCMCELRRHRSMDDCWLVAYGNVYNITGIMRAHPGGARCLLRKAGGPDCAQDMDFHTKKARRMMDKCFIGKLEPCGEIDAAGQATCSIM